MGKLGKVFGLGKKGKISISIEKPSCIAGELIHAVVLKATGKEKVSWEQRIGQEFETEDFEREHEFFKEKIILSQIPHTLQPGDYVYPFQYQLPSTLPGVFSLERYACLGVNNLEATVQYKFKATLEDLKARTYVVVHERLAQRIQPSQDSITQNIHWFCCLSRGKCTLAVAMDKNVYLPGETAQILCHITNDSHVNISALRCHLYQDITLTLAFPEAQTFTRLIAEARFSGVPAVPSSSDR
ncbi:hypothetical protein Poli38472_008342 [Pythium oligandrum]|uniref:Arrestin C-terminal-like domain-containing protein n=1 Tax=Pythium oligandrum TaxID=41045 RepID=A0A8K1FJ50_PYTOL|nr:hypothetical protein Poli38472_008342 [Pythium oligandrum]|eukprot:TMW65700.1 hypothetical protein Poli38472_008342 [Pythium oligandrum]